MRGVGRTSSISDRAKQVVIADVACPCLVHFVSAELHLGHALGRCMYRVGYSRPCAEVPMLRRGNGPERPLSALLWRLPTLTAVLLPRVDKAGTSWPPAETPPTAYPT